MSINVTISGEDVRKVKWTGEVRLDDSDPKNVHGTIDWKRGSRGSINTETVVGTLAQNGEISLEGTRVSRNILKCCSYRGTWKGDRMDLKWNGRGSCPDGWAKSAR